MNTRKFRQSQTYNFYTLLWLVAVVIAGYLFYNSQINLSYLGVVEKRVHFLGPQESGKIFTMLAEVGEEVEKGQVLAYLDMSDLKVSLELLKNEFDEISKLNQSQKNLNTIELQRIRMQAENEYAALLERFSLIESNIVELNGLNEEIKRLQGAKDAGLGYNRSLPDLIIRRDALEGYLKEQRLEFNRLSHKLQDIRESREQFESADVDNQTKSLMLEQLEYPESIRREIAFTEHRMEMRTIYSPCDGFVTDILAQPGNVIQDFDSLIVVEESKPQFMTVYLSEKSKITPEVGCEVKINSARKTDYNTTGQIKFVHPGFEKTSGRLTFRGQSFWARRIRVELPEAHQLLPGELVTVRISRHKKQTKQQIANLQAAEQAEVLDKLYPGHYPALNEMHVPESIWKMSRFEPSGIVWVPEIEKYLIVSDDTGIEDTKSDHAPYVFLMDEKGVVETQPFRLSGIHQVNDLESVTSIGNNQYIFCSSQNISKRGKRPQNREYLLLVERNNSGFKVIKKVNLLSLIERSYSSAEQAQLGLIRKEKDGRLIINIEGIAFQDNTLLIALKEPSLNGRAILLQLSDMESIFDIQRLYSNQLSLFGTVNLGSYKGKSATFSDIHIKSDGVIYALSTIADVSDDIQMGTFHRIEKQSNGKLKADAIARFPNMKPEGICLDPYQQFFVVVDCDNRTPLFCTLDVEG